MGLVSWGKVFLAWRAIEKVLENQGLLVFLVGGGPFWVLRAAAGGSGDILLLFLSLSSARGSDSALGCCIAVCFDQL